ncbi:MAG: PAS domain S-box protein [Bacteroidales bacterium]
MKNKMSKNELLKKISSLEEEIRLLKKDDILVHTTDIFKNIQTGMHIYELEDIENDRTLRLIAANPATEKLTGIPADEIIGNTIDENFPNLRSKNIPQQYAAVIKTKKPIELEEFYYSDMRIIAAVFHIKAFPLSGQRVCITFDNITEKKKAEEDLLNSTKYLKGILNASPSIIYVFCLIENNIKYISDKIQSVSGYSVEELYQMNNPLSRIVHPNNHEDISILLGKIKKFEIEQIKDFEIQIIKKDQSKIWISISALVFEKTEPGGVSQILGSISEITDRKQAELELIKSEEKYRLIVEGQSDMVVKIDKNKQYLFVSPSYCEKYGVSEHELLNSEYLPLINEEDRLKNSVVLSNLDKPPYTCSIEQREMTRYGWRWIAWSMRAILDEDSAIKEIIYIGRDITDKKNAENALIESEERYRTLFDQSADGILVCDSSVKIIDLNRNVSKITGFSKQELLGLTLDKLFDITETNKKPLRIEYLKTGELIVNERTLISKNGIKIKVEISKKQLSDGRIQVLLLDITEKKKAESALIESEQKYRLLFESAADAIFMMRGTEFIDCNKATLKIYGCKREEIIGHTPFRFSPLTQPDGANSKTQALKHIQNAMEHGPQNFEWQHIKYNGTPFDAEVTLQKIELSGEIFLQAIVRDITSRKQSENALKERESQLAETNQMLELILNTIPVRVFWKDRNFKFIGCNKLFAKDAGFDNPKNLIGKTDFELNWKDQAEKYRADDAKILSSESPMIDIEEPQTTPEGNIIWIKTNKIQLKNLNNQTIGILGTYEDITERKQIEKKIIDAIIKTEEKEREKFAKNLHDDLGPLLSSIKMYVNSIIEASPTKQMFIVEQLNEIVKEAIQSTKEISNDLSPHVLKNYGLVAAVQFFSRRVENLIQTDFDTNITDQRFPEEVETSVYRIIKELFNNTIKHAKANKITLSLLVDDKKLKIFFADNGSGFNISGIERKDAMGMGISNIISRVRSLKGFHSITSALNQGMKFLLEIPLP